MKSLLLITHEYPLKRGDANFIESEVQFLSKKFDKVYIFCLSKYYNDDSLILPKNVLVKFRDRKYEIIKKCIALLILTFTPIFYQELVSLVRNKKISIKILYFMISFLASAIFLQSPIKLILKQAGNIGLVYTYWYTQETLSILLLKKSLNNIPCVTRTHGYDLYKFRNSMNYQPFKLWMDKKIDKIFFISNHGYNYYLNEFAGCDLQKYMIARLGILNNLPIRTSKTSNDLSISVICSCSYIVSLKRIHFIINALEKIEQYRIHWIHIGDGPDGNIIRSIASKALRDKNNISYEFKGFMTNEEVMQFYSKNYIDCFLSASESEGLPVSMMEAISFGIPVIATSVGGVPEIINSDFGILLGAEGNISEMSKAILDFYNLSEEKRGLMRRSARSFWESNFNAAINHVKFSEVLLIIAQM